MFPTNLSPFQQLLVYAAYGLLLAVVLWTSVTDLTCHFRGREACFKRRMWLKVPVGIVLILTLLVLLAYAILIMGMSHGSSPSGTDILLVIGIALTPIVFIVMWMIGSRVASGVFALSLSALILYFTAYRPELSMGLLAENDVVFAQLWLAKRQTTVRDGQIVWTGRAQHWYMEAAKNGDAEAQYQVGLRLSRVHRPSSGVEWFRKAAEQGHVDAMVEMARWGQGEEERDSWLEAAFERRHPEALYMKAAKLGASDLPEARELMLEAAEGGSAAAMGRLAQEYATGGILFDQDLGAAKKWSKSMQRKLAETTDYSNQDHWLHSDKLAGIEEQLEQIKSGDPDTLFETAERILRSRDADEVAKKRAMDYLERAAGKGHPEAAFELGKRYGLDNPDPEAAKTALHWYERAADAGNMRAMERLVFHFRGNDSDYPVDLNKAQEYNKKIIDLIEQNPGRFNDSLLHKWSSIYWETEKLVERDRKRGGSMVQLEAAAAKDDAHAKFVYGKEMLRLNYEEGMSNIREAAVLGDKDARFYLAETTLHQPRTMDQEKKAITELQKLAGQDYGPACLMLGFTYFNTHGVVRSNQYLARRLFEKAKEDPEVEDRALRALEHVPAMTAELNLEGVEDVLAAIESWYEKQRAAGADPEALDLQYRNLKAHFQPADELRTAAEKGDPDSQFAYGQHLLNRNLERALYWIGLAAEQGLPEAQYEMAQRVFRSKINPPEQYAMAMHGLEAAAANRHVGAMVFLAGQYATGREGVYDQDIAKAKRIFKQALSSTQDEVLYSGEFVGRQIIVRRESIEKRLTELD